MEEKKEIEIVTQTKKWTRTQVQKFKDNPFLSNETVKTRQKKVSYKTSDNFMIVNQNSGELTETKPAGFWTTKEIDDEQFVKVYFSAIKQLAELKKPGMRVFELLYLQVQVSAIDKDKVYLTHLLAEDFNLTIDASTFSKGLKELREKDFIADSYMPNLYFFNPSFMFNGDRMVVATEFKRKQKTKQQDVKTIDMFEES